LIDLAPSLARVISFILSFSAIAIVISIIGSLFQRIINVIFLSFVNRLLGSLVAVGALIFFLSILLNLVLMLDSSETVIKKEIKDESYFFKRVEAVVPAVVPYLNKELWDKYVPKSYREEIESKSDSLLNTQPTGNNIDSLFQQKHFIVD